MSFQQTDRNAPVLTHAQDLQAARARQLALIAIAAANAAARRPRPPLRVEPPRRPTEEVLPEGVSPAGMTEQVRRLGLWRPVVAPQDPHQATGDGPSPASAPRG